LATKKLLVKTDLKATMLIGKHILTEIKYGQMKKKVK